MDYEQWTTNACLVYIRAGIVQTSAFFEDFLYLDPLSFMTLIFTQLLTCVGHAGEKMGVHLRHDFIINLLTRGCKRESISESELPEYSTGS